MGIKLDLDFSPVQSLFGENQAKHLNFIQELIRKCRAIFICYAPDKRYRKAYESFYPDPKSLWKPVPIGYFELYKQFGIVFALPATESELRKATFEELLGLHQWMEKVKKHCGAEQATIAGIGASIMNKRGIIRDQVERRVTATAICQAIEKVKRWENLSPKTNIIILGGDGYIGRAVREKLGPPKNGSGFFSLDLRNKDLFPVLLPVLIRRPTIIINISTRNAIKPYLRQIKTPWSKLVILNEVFPEPSGEIIGMAKHIGSKVYHIVGGNGEAWPPFPWPYSTVVENKKRGVPCCACFMPDEGQKFRVLLEKL